jgi:hypothetical protein
MAASHKCRALIAEDMASRIVPPNPQHELLRGIDMTEAKARRIVLAARPLGCPIEGEYKSTTADTSPRSCVSFSFSGWSHACLAYNQRLERSPDLIRGIERLERLKRA